MDQLHLCNGKTFANHTKIILKVMFVARNIILTVLTNKPYEVGGYVCISMYRYVNVNSCQYNKEYNIIQYNWKISYYIVMT